MTGQLLKRLQTLRNFWPWLGRASSNSQRGFTMMELLISCGIATVGLYASITLALSAMSGNAERRNSILAEQFAQHLLATIQSDALAWTDATPPASYGVYVLHAPTPPSPGVSSGWINVPTAAFASDKRVGAVGSDKVYDAGLLAAMPSDVGTRFCGHFRLTWVSADLLRAEVRVSWPKQGVPFDMFQECPADMVYNVGLVGSMTLPAMVMRNVYVH